MPPPHRGSRTRGPTNPVIVASAAAAAGASATSAAAGAAPRRTSSRSNGLYTELGGAKGLCGSLAVAFRYLTLNVLVEHFIEEESPAGDVNNLLAIYNLIALVEALLLRVHGTSAANSCDATALRPNPLPPRSLTRSSVGISPFMDMQVA